MIKYALLKDDIERERRFYDPPLSSEIKEELYWNLLLEIAEKLISCGIKHFGSKNEIDKRQFNINICIGTEILCKSIIVKKMGIRKIIRETGRKNSLLNKFIEKIKKILNIETNKRIITISLNDSIKIIRKILKNDLVDKKTIGRIIDVLNLIKIRRNNMAHLGIRTMEHYNRKPRQIFLILNFLIKKYFGESDLTKIIENLIEKIKAMPSEEDYEPVDFSI